MRKLKKIKAVLMTLGIIFAFSFLNNSDFSFFQGNNYGNLERDNETALKKSGYWEIGPIFIDDYDPSFNWAITEETQPWCNLIDGVYVIENVTIDGQNFDSCIHITRSTVPFIIRNCTLFNSKNGNAGVYLERTSNGRIINNNCSNNNGYGIFIKQNTAIGNCNNNTILGNIISYNNLHGILISADYGDCDNIKICNNTVSHNKNSGIFIHSSGGTSDNNIIWKNTVNFNQYNGIEIYSHYDVSSCNFNNISKNNIKNNSKSGIVLSSIEETCYFNNILGNVIINNTENGIILTGCYYNYIRDKNIIKDNENGIHLVSNEFRSSKYNIISDNLMVNNSYYGVLISTDSEYNKIYNNSFCLNTIHGYDQGTNNQWDNGSLGNYWDDYGGVDADDDGIGDTPYDVPPVGGSVDNYPIWSDEDDVGPDISINSPINDEIFGIDAPNFTITITDQTLNTTWYTIDGGLTNFTFSRFEGTVNQSAWDDKASGPILLRFYANDSVGNIDFEDVNIEKDADAPTITINSPTPNQMCGVPAPSFDVIINDPHFHKKWYSLDGGENITYTTETQIDQIEWDKFGNGTVLITFYANDTLGNENSTQVKVRKDVYLPKIFIISPIPDELFEETPPFFNVEIRDPNLHKMWYRIDSGMPKIFTENESITQSLWDAASEGIIDLTFFANDTAGNVNFTSVNIIKDTLIPSIEIISPEPNEIFREIAPSFEISITEVNVVSRWYSIDGGLTNKSFIGLNGTINEILWWDAPLGPITIRFYAEDIAGNIGFEDVVVIKKLIKSLSVEIVEQSFSKEAFNITFLLYNETEHGISNAAIQLWWDGTEILSGIQNLGNGLYFVSLEPITVASGEEPILLSMIITVDGYEDKYFETFLAVDPETLEKGIEKDGEEFPFIIIIIAIVSSAGGIGATIITIGILRKRKPTKEVI